MSLVSTPRWSGTSVAMIPVDGDGVSTGVQDVSGSEVLVTKSPKSTGTTLRDGELAILEAGNPDHVVATFHAPQGPKPRQVLHAVLSGRYAVWMETPSTDLSAEPWRMFVYDRRTHAVAEIARSHQMDDGGPAVSVPGFTNLALVRDQIYWIETSGTFGRPVATLRRCSVLHCRPTNVLRGAAFPFVDGGAVYAATSEGFEGRRTEKSFQIVRIDPRMNTTKVVRSVPLAQGWFLDFVTGGGGRFAWITRGGLTPTSAPEDMASSTLTIATTDDVLYQSTEDNGSFAYPDAGPAGVVWGQSDGNYKRERGGYFWNATDGRVELLGDTTGLYGVGTAGDLIWFQKMKGDAGNRTIIGRVGR